MAIIAVNSMPVFTMPSGYRIVQSIDDNSQNAQTIALQTAMDKVFYQQWGLLGFGISGLFTIGRYISRTPYLSNIVPKTDQLFKIKNKDGQTIDLRKEGIKQNGADLLEIFLPIMYYLEKSKDKTKEEKTELREKINNWSENRIQYLKKKWLPGLLEQHNQSFEEYMQRFMEEHWHNREYVPVGKALGNELISSKHSMYGQKFTISDHITLDLLIQDRFFKHTLHALEHMPDLLNRDMAKFKIKAAKHYRYYTGCVMESALGIGEVLLFSLGGMAAALTAIGPWLSNYLYSLAQATPKVKNNKYKKIIGQLVSMQKASASGLKRLGTGGPLAFLEVACLSWLKKTARDQIEDRTNIHKDMKRILEKRIRRPGIAGAIAKWPIKIACDFAILGLGIYLITLLKELWKQSHSGQQELSSFMNNADSR